MEYIMELVMHPVMREIVFWLLLVGIIGGASVYLAGVLSNGNASGREWPENQWPPPGCTPPTRADRKTGFTRE